MIRLITIFLLLCLSDTLTLKKQRVAHKAIHVLYYFLRVRWCVFQVLVNGKVWAADPWVRAPSAPLTTKTVLAVYIFIFTLTKHQDLTLILTYLKQLSARMPPNPCAFIHFYFYTHNAPRFYTDFNLLKAAKCKNATKPLCF